MKKYLFKKKNIRKDHLLGKFTLSGNRLNGKDSGLEFGILLHFRGYGCSTTSVTGEVRYVCSYHSYSGLQACGFGTY